MRIHKLTDSNIRLLEGDNALYIGSDSPDRGLVANIWANPLRNEYSRISKEESMITGYFIHLLRKPVLIEAIQNLPDNLICNCDYSLCHGYALQLLKSPVVWEKPESTPYDHSLPPSLYDIANSLMRATVVMRQSLLKHAYHAKHIEAVMKNYLKTKSLYIRHENDDGQIRIKAKSDFENAENEKARVGGIKIDAIRLQNRAIQIARASLFAYAMNNYKEYKR